MLREQLSNISLPPCLICPPSTPLLLYPKFRPRLAGEEREEREELLFSIKLSVLYIYYDGAILKAAVYWLGWCVLLFFPADIFQKKFNTEHSQTLLRKCKSKTISNFSAINFPSDITITKHPNIVLIKKLIKNNESGVNFF